MISTKPSKIIQIGWDKYKKFALSLLKFYKKIPTVVWGGFAVIGILFVGTMIGYGAGFDYQSSPTKLDSIKDKNAKYVELINGYEDLSRLESYQDDNIKIVLDPNILNEHPDEFYQAAKSLGDYRDKILIQSGKIIELRRQAGFTNYSAK